MNSTEKLQYHTPTCNEVVLFRVTYIMLLSAYLENKFQVFFRFPLMPFQKPSAGNLLWEL